MLMQYQLINYNDHNSIINVVMIFVYIHWFCPSANQIEGLFCKIMQSGELCSECWALGIGLFLLNILM